MIDTHCWLRFRWHTWVTLWVNQYAAKQVCQDCGAERMLEL